MSDAIQVWLHGNYRMPPPCPSLAELLTGLNTQPAKVSRVIENPESGFRNARKGHGRCDKCLKPKKNEEFASRTGLICNDCKQGSGGRGGDVKKRVARNMVAISGED